MCQNNVPKLLKGCDNNIIYFQMTKCNPFSRIFRLKFKQACFYMLLISATFCFFAYHGYYNYKCVKRSEIEKLLYRKINPSLGLPSSMPPCKYELLKSSQSYKPEEVYRMLGNLSTEGVVNGSYTPNHCLPEFSVAILITYRNRQSHLDTFIPYIHNFLKKQNIHYKIYLIEQQDEKPWNKGVLYNVGAKIAISDEFPCLILHDIDLLPLDEANLYTCLQEPRHMSGSIDKHRYVLPYNILVGGVSALQSSQYIQIDGFSNRFYRWGGEDDDLAYRIMNAGLGILRFPHDMSRYIMLHHLHQEKNLMRHRIIAENQKERTIAPNKDGLSNVKYTSIQVTYRKLYTHIYVQL